MSKYHLYVHNDKVHFESLFGSIKKLNIIMADSFQFTVWTMYEGALTLVHNSL